MTLNFGVNALLHWVPKCSITLLFLHNFQEEDGGTTSYMSYSLQMSCKKHYFFLNPEDISLKAFYYPITDASSNNAN